MRVLRNLFENNRAWADNIRLSDPEFFQRLSRQQSPDYLWIGCSDSRVPANQIVGLLPGEMFVHRNVANVVEHSDLNCMSVLQFAVDVLKVKHVIVCGHYGCAGIRAVQCGNELGLVDQWLKHVRKVWDKHAPRLVGAQGEHCTDRLCELNVIEQVANVCGSEIARASWCRGQELTVHGWIYDLKDGILRDLNVTVTDFHQTDAVYQAAISGLFITGPMRLNQG